MTYTEFENLVRMKHKDQSDLRLGQMFFHELFLVRPNIAEELQGAELDPFYKNHISQDLRDFVQSRW